MERILLFDGDCHFCNGAVQFISKRDQHGHFKFAPLQSELGQELLQHHRIPLDENSFILIEQNKSYSKSTAALHVCKKLDGFWKVLFPLLMIPRPIRDFFYQIIANNRYTWFGKKQSCPLPPPHIRKRFLS